MRLVATIIRIVLLGLVGASGTFVIDLMQRSTPSMAHDPFAVAYVYVGSVLIAMLAGVLSAIQIHDYLHSKEQESEA